MPFRLRYAPPEPHLVKKSTFPTPQDAETAFYEALESADLDAMMEVWAHDEEIVCVHPGGPRLAGYEQVRGSWAQIFGSGQRLKVHVSNQVVLSGMMLVIHSVHENILVQGEPRPRQPVAVTNVYLRTGNGWRMILHHGSPAPPEARSSPESPKILH
ncbi:MAG TPA: nuclear transport factor 2 family protein [Burkholderiales bacterium]|nr:nuclear transport factor 2 family protein [Burkholderiales bacterium]